MERTNDDWLLALNSDDPVVRDEATGDLQSRLRRTIFAQFLAKGLSGSCIDDIVQETSFRVFNKLDTFRGDSQFLTWATAYAVRTGLEMIRRGFWATRTASDFMADDDKVDLANQWKSGVLSPDSEAQQQEALELLTKAMNEFLTTRQRCALLRELQGWPVARIAMELGTSRGAVYKLTHDARKKLKLAFEDAGFDGNAIRELFSL